MGNSLRLHRACHEGDLEKVKSLLEKCENSKDQINIVDDHMRTALHYACITSKKNASLQGKQVGENELRREGIVEREREGEEVNKEKEEENQNQQEQEKKESEEHPSQYQSSEEIITSHPAIEIIQLLQEQGADLNQEDSKGWTPLHYACAVKNIQLIKYLIEENVKVIRDTYGILPQDLLIQQQQQYFINEDRKILEILKEKMDKTLESNEYEIQVYCLRSSGIHQLDFGDKISVESFVTVEFHVPENHSTKDMLQMLIYQGEQNPINMTEPEFGMYQYVPEGNTGTVIFKMDTLPLSSICRFVYVKSNINQLNRQVVASGGTVQIVSTVPEHVQYELFLHDRVIEVEATRNEALGCGNVIMMKRIGLVLSESEVEWINVYPGNHIIAVDDEYVSANDFEQALSLLQNHRQNESTRLLMQNYNVVGDFIPEKVLGPGVVGKFASLKVPQGTVLKMKSFGEQEEEGEIENTFNEQKHDCSALQPNDAVMHVEQERKSEIMNEGKETSNDLAEDTHTALDPTRKNEHTEVDSDENINIEKIDNNESENTKQAEDITSTNIDSETKVTMDHDYPDTDCHSEIGARQAENPYTEGENTRIKRKIFSPTRADYGSDDEFEDAVSGKEHVHVVLTSMKDLPGGENLMKDMISGVHLSIDSAIANKR